VLTYQELSEGLGAGGGDGQRELVHGHAVRHRQRVDLPVRDLARQQLPQQHAKTTERQEGTKHKSRKKNNIEQTNKTKFG